MNLNLSKVIEKIASDSKLSEEFSKLDEMDEIYDYCKNMGVRCEKKEFDNEISKYIDVLNDDTYEKEIFEEKLGNVGGGVNLKNKFSRSVASLLSALTMGSTAGLGSVGATDNLKVSNDLRNNVPFSEKISNEWLKTKEALYKFYQNHKKIFIVVEITVGVLVIAGAAILIKHRINDARAKKVERKGFSKVKGKTPKTLEYETTNKVKKYEIQKLVEKKMPENNDVGKSVIQKVEEKRTTQSETAQEAEDIQLETLEKSGIIKSETPQAVGENVQHRKKKRTRGEIILSEEPIQEVETIKSKASERIGRNVQNRKKKRTRGKIILSEEPIQEVETIKSKASEGVGESVQHRKKKRTRGKIILSEEPIQPQRIEEVKERRASLAVLQEEARRQKAAIDREERYNLIISAREKSMKKSRENSTFKKLVEDWNSDPTEENFEAIKKFVKDHKEGDFLGKYEELFPRNMYLQAVKNNSTAENWDAVYSNTKLYNKKIRARAKAMRDMERLREAGKQGIFERFFSSKNPTALSQEAEKSVSEAEKLGVKGIREVFDELKRELKLK